MKIKEKRLYQLLWLLLFLASIVGMRVLGSFPASPFVFIPQQAFGESFAWAYDCFSSTQIWWYVSSDWLFAVLLLLFYYWLYKRTRQNKKSRFWWLPILLAVGACSFDVAEGFLIVEQHPAFSWVNKVKSVCYLLAWIWLVFVTIRYCLRLWSNWKWKALLPIFLQQYLHYFYPGIISIIAFYFIVNSLDQFDVLVFDLAQAGNLIIFIVLFAATLIKVWFLPYYVQFSNSFYDLLITDTYNKKRTRHQEKVVVRPEHLQKALSYKGLFLPISSLLVSEVSEEVNIKSDLLSEKEKQAPFKRKELARILRKINLKIRPEEVALTEYPSLTEKKELNLWTNSLFHTVRQYVGLCFILILLWLQVKTLSEVAPWVKGFEFIFLALVGLSLVATQNYLSTLVRNPRTIKEAAAKKEISFGEAAITEKNRQNIKGGAVFLFLLAAITWSLTALLYFTEQLADVTMLCFGTSTIFAAFGFVFFTVFRYPTVTWEKDEEGLKEEEGKKVNEANKIRKNNDKWQKILTGLLMGYITFIIPLLFLLLVVVSLFDLSFFSWLNPINYYLLYVNGIIALMAVGNRFLLLRIRQIAPDYQRVLATNPAPSKRQRAYAKRGFVKKRIHFLRKRLALTLTLCLVLFFLRQSNNYHHQINYLSPDNKTVKPTFEEYTADFIAEIDTAASKNIYFIAAEGGGLRAAYWTMLVLQQLEPDIRQRTFMMSGASGGAIGQGALTFLNYQQVEKGQRDQLIEEIGSTSYLTTDLAGLLTRGVVGSVVSLPVMAKYPDRHRVMAKTYFNILGGADKGPTYWKTASEKAFHYPWTTASESHLPFIMVNTTRTRDGSRGIVHPFREEEGLFQNFQNLATNYRGEQISYADAMFLTNRFPIVSPAARITDKGYFADGGYYENSGIQSILEVLQYLGGKAQADPTSIYHDLIELNPVVINIRNSSSSFLSGALDEFGITQDSINHVGFQRDLGNVLSAVTAIGTEGLPYYYHRLLSDSVMASAYQIGDYKTVDLPYRVDDPRQLHQILGGQIVTDNCRLNKEVEWLNDSIAAQSTVPPNKVLMPALGRSISDHTLQYMKDMLQYYRVKQEIDQINTLR